MKKFLKDFWFPVLSIFALLLIFVFNLSQDWYNETHLSESDYCQSLSYRSIANLPVNCLKYFK